MSNQIVTKDRPRHILVIATLAEDNFCDVFFVLRGTCIVSHGIDFVMFFGLGSDEKLVSQISDAVRIVTKFVTKTHVFVTEYIL